MQTAVAVLRGHCCLCVILAITLGICDAYAYVKCDFTGHGVASAEDAVACHSICPEEERLLVALIPLSASCGDIRHRLGNTCFFPAVAFPERHRTEKLTVFPSMNSERLQDSLLVGEEQARKFSRCGIQMDNQGL